MINIIKQEITVDESLKQRLVYMFTTIIERDLAISN